MSFTLIKTDIRYDILDFKVHVVIYKILLFLHTNCFNLFFENDSLEICIPFKKLPLIKYLLL